MVRELVAADVEMFLRQLLYIFIFRFLGPCHSTYLLNLYMEVCTNGGA